MSENLFLVIGLLAFGMFSGLMMTLVFVMQRQWMLMEKDRYARNFKEFLSVAKGHPLISLLTFLCFLVPFGLALFYFINNEMMAGILSTASGLAFFCGGLLVTLKLNFPIYDKVMSWNPPDISNDWQEVRKRFFALNILRMSSALISFILLALVLFINSQG